MKLFYQMSEYSQQEIEFIRFQVVQTDPSEISEVEINFGGLDIPDSSFLSHLLHIHMYLKSKRIPLRLTNLSPSSRQVLQYSSMDRILKIPTPVPPTTLPEADPAPPESNYSGEEAATGS